MAGVTSPDLAILGADPAYPDGLPLLRPTLPALDAVEPGLRAAFESGIVTKGPALREYERRLADHLGVEHALAVSSCTAGLMLTLDAFRGGEVILPSFTFMATAMAAVWAGLEPVFCDIDPETWCLDPARAEELIGPDTVAIVPVHIFGAPADTAAFEALGQKHGLPVIYDAAHGFGALDDGGAPVGREGLAQCFSTSPTKLLITGEGGVVATDDDTLAERVVIGREYGNPGDYDPIFVGLNARMPEASALLGLAGLELLEGEALRRNSLAAIYREALGDMIGVTFQKLRSGTRSSYKDLSIRIGRGFGLTRDELAATLAADGVDTRAYYVPAVHRTRAFGAFSDLCDPALPQTNALCDEVLTLPCYGRMGDADVERVCALVRTAHERADAVRATLHG
jgi:dTDP-4-amino-4,6-dideoxygalactose transaminase